MSTMLMLIPVVVFLTSVMLVYGSYRLLVQRRELVRARLAHYAVDVGTASLAGISSGVLRDRQLSSIRAVDAILTRSGLGEKTAIDLARAAIPLRVGEYLLIRWVAALALFVVGTLLVNFAIGLVLAICGYFIPKLYVSHCEQERVRKIDGQLVDTLSLMANSLRAGFGLLQGFEAVAREMPDPISEEFDQVLSEIRVGATTDQALIGLGERVRSADLDLIITAMLIHRSVGGNLSEILDTIGHTIRERVRILRDIRTLTAQERLSGYVIGALPIFLLVVISFANRSYIEMLFFTPIGRAMLVAGAILEIIGFYISRKITEIEV